MATVKNLKKISMNEIIKENNKILKDNLIPFGYKPYEISKGFDNAFENPIEADSYKVEQLFNNQ